MTGMDRLATGFGLLEGPLWDPTRGLLFADADIGGVYCLAETGEIREVVAHRRGIGGMVLHEAGGLIVSGRNIAYKAPTNDPTVVLVANDPPNGIIGFNDITSDLAGRVYAGSLGFFPTVPGDKPKPGALYVIDVDGSTRLLAKDVKLTNGLGFSPDGRLLYHCDSGDQTIYVYDAIDGGGVRGRRPFLRVSEGLPNGIAVSADGAVWVALAHASRVIAINPDGSIRRSLTFPVPMVTSLCFGGRDLQDLYVVTGSEGANPQGRHGSIFRLRSDVPGLRMARARVSIPAHKAPSGNDN